MPQGLQVWDANGLLIVDTSTLLPRAIQLGDIDSSGSVNIPVLTSPTIRALPVVDIVSGTPPVVSIDNSGNVQWSKTNGRDYQARLSVMLL